MKAGGPYVLEVSSGTVTQRVEDVRVGTVVLAAGQSNAPTRTRNWSAIGYHVAREIRARRGEAVGVINC